MTGLQISYEINIVSLGTLLAACLTGLKFILDLQTAATIAKTEALKANERITIMEGSIAIYRERIATEYVSIRYLNEMEERVLTEIRSCRDRVDRLLERKAVS